MSRGHKSTASRTIIIGLTACGNTKWIPINWPAFFRIPRGVVRRVHASKSSPPTTRLDGRSAYPSATWKYLGVFVRRLSLHSWSRTCTWLELLELPRLPLPDLIYSTIWSTFAEFERIVPRIRKATLDRPTTNGICLWESWNGRGGSLSPSGQCRFWAEFISRNGSLGTSSRYHGDVGSWIIG